MKLFYYVFAMTNHSVCPRCPWMAREIFNFGGGGGVDSKV